MRLLFDLGYWRFSVRLFARETRDRWVRRLADWLPRAVVLQAFVRVWAEGTPDGGPGSVYGDLYRAWEAETKVRRNNRRLVWRLAGWRGLVFVGAAAFASILSLLLVGCSSSGSGSSLFVTLQAQTLPYTLTVAWDASPDAATYSCFLDGVVQKTGVTGLQCSFPVSTLGAHTVAVTAVNPSSVPPESAPASLAFTLRNPAAPGGIKVR